MRIPKAGIAAIPAATQSRRTAIAQLFGLCGFAIAQPLFDLLSNAPTFFVAHELSGSDVVALALALVLVPPQAFTALELVASAVSRALGERVHLLSVALLATATALGPLSRLGPLESHGFVAAGIALAFGAVFAVCNLRIGAVATFTTLLAFAPVAFLAWFVSTGPVGRLVAAGGAVAATGPRDEAPLSPVVLVIFDELPLNSLLAAPGRLDRVRFPHFAALADRSIWFREATTVSGYTPTAVPALLTGRLPEPERSPTAIDHPENLFTLLAGRYEIEAWESGTQLIPAQRPTGLSFARIAPAALDVGLLSLHATLPKDLATGLPPVGLRWGGFVAPKLRGLIRREGDRARRFRSFVDSIERGDKPRLHYLHSMLPHLPWEWLPSGERYRPNTQLGLNVTRWSQLEWWSVMGQQRHLLQTGFVDHLLGELIARLDELDLFEDCLRIVTSDHGASFWPGADYRGADRGIESVLRIPLFVKLPGQRKGRADDRDAETIDLLPTLTDALGLELPWPVDGCSLLDASCPGRAEKRFFTPGPRELPDDLLARSESLRRQLGWFGRGPWERVYALGPYRGLVGRPVTAEPDPTLRFEATSGREDLRVRGALYGAGDRGLIQVAIATGGIIRTIVPAVRAKGADAHTLDGMLPAASAAIELFLVDGPPGSPSLRAIPR